MRRVVKVQQEDTLNSGGNWLGWGTESGKEIRSSSGPWM